MKKIITLFFLMALGITTTMSAQAVGDYGSIATGNWSGTTTWGIWDGATFVATSTPPDGTQNVFLQTGFTVTVTATVNFKKTLTLNGGSMVAGTSPNNFQTSGTTAVITRASTTGTLTGTCTLSGGASTDVTTVNINATTANGGSETNSGGGTLGKVHLNIASGVSYLLNGNRQFDNLDLQGTLSDFNATARTFTVKGNITGTGSQIGTAATTGVIMNFNSGSINISGVTLKNLTISSTNGNTYNLTGNVTVTNVLALTGQPATLVNRINLGTNNLTVGSITLGTIPSKNYVQADGSGRLTVKSVSTTPIVFPIGTGASYEPFSIKTTNTVDVSAKVTTVFTGTPLDATKASARQWDITPSAATGACAFTFTPSVLPSAGTYTTNPALGHYNGSAWEEFKYLTYASGTWSMSQYNGTFSPFAVGSEGAFAAVALAVDLSKFDVKKSQSAALLAWSTASEKNNAYFNIEQSTNGVNFQTVGQVKGNGTTNAASNYNFEHLTPAVGVNYYRLKQVDVDGTTTLSAVKSVVFGKTGLVVKNTLADATLEVVVSDEVSTPLSIFNISGQQIMAVKAQGTQRFDISALTSGVYFIRTATGDVARFVKQ